MRAESSAICTSGDPVSMGERRNDSMALFTASRRAPFAFAVFSANARFASSRAAPDIAKKIEYPSRCCREWMIKKSSLKHLIRLKRREEDGTSEV